jgi:hypothetical protein
MTLISPRASRALHLPVPALTHHAGFSQGGAAAAYLLALAREQEGSPMAQTRFVVVAGSSAESLFGDAHGLVLNKAPFVLPSLHLIGETDAAVAPALSETFAGLFAGASIVRHAQGHVFPQRAAELDTIMQFVTAFDSAPDTAVRAPRSGDVAPFDASDQQREEMEALKAIFDADCELASLRPPRVAITLGDLGPPAPRIVFTLTPAYPAEPPAIDCDLNGVLGKDRTRARAAGVCTALRREAVAQTGSEMLFQLVGLYREAIAEAQAALVAEAEAAEQAAPARMTGVGDDDTDHTAFIKQATHEAAQVSENGNKIFIDSTCRGSWSYVIGLVGKPSAGKSTLFNAATDPEDPAQIAKMASFPFTTIDPNVGVGCVSVPCPGAPLGLHSTPPLGFTAHKRRRMAVTLKDVAGLVPGAYQGRGKGNAFLNDLCDAHVLIHVVDASGQTDQGGAATDGDGGDPLGDIAWIRAEVRAYVYIYVSI